MAPNQSSQMRNTANFHPEWGYLAPAPSFIRKARVVLIATAVGATFGAGAVLSRVSHQTTELSVGERTLVRPAETSAQATQGNPSPLTEKRSLAVNSRSADGAANEPSASSMTRAPAAIAALTETAAATLPTGTLATPPAAARKPVLNLVPIKRKVLKKSTVAWRFAFRDEPLALARGEYYKRRDRGQYYGDGGSRRYDNW
jgi:hypothetical protein